MSKKSTSILASILTISILFSVLTAVGSFTYIQQVEKAGTQSADGFNSDMDKLKNSVREQHSKLENMEKENQELHSRNEAYSKEIGQLQSQLSSALLLAEQAVEVNANVKPTRSTDAITEKTAFLTFDDGPSANTPKLLKVLEEEDVKATFFVTAQSHSEYLKDIADAGHTLALHTYSHDYNKIYKSTDAYFSDLKKIQDLVFEKTGIRSTLLRFPGGSSNTVSRNSKKGIMTLLTKEVEKQGYTYFDWNCDSGDASGNNIAPERLLENVKNSAGRQKCINILMHDTTSKATTIEALPSIIAYLRSKGYVFKPLSETSPAVHHQVNN